MTLGHSKSVALFVLLALPVLGAGCAASSDPASGESADAVAAPLIVNPIGPPGGGRPPVGPVGPTYAPPVTLPSYLDTGSSRTAVTVPLGWNESVVNPHTQIWRQKYDLDDNAVGAPTLIKTFDKLPVGNVSFTDGVATTIDHSGPAVDRKNCYQIVETTGDCNASPGGPDCLRTQWACAYTRGAVEHTVGRVQLRLKVGSLPGAGAPSNALVQVRLQSPTLPYALLPQPRNNRTWIDSWQSDFQAGSNITYDLDTNGVSDLSDITMITVANANSDDLCINELELIADNKSVFLKSWGPSTACAPTMNSNDTLNGKVVTVPFGELRRAPSWINFNPPNLSPISTVYRSFVGFRGPELISYLDTAMAGQLKNPANGHGADAGLEDGFRTTTTQISRTRLRVAQHIIGDDEGWQGDVSANTYYDLVIHTDAATCGARKTCIKIENISAVSDFSGWSADIPFIGLGVQAVVDNIADGEIQNALKAMGATSLGEAPMGYEFCFLSGMGAESPVAYEGFGAGSMTICFPNE